MKTIATILFRIESPNGDDEKQVPLGEVPKAVNELVVDGKWATLDKADGTSETITAPVKEDDWEKVFGNTEKPKVKSVVGTSKVGGG